MSKVKYLRWWDLLIITGIMIGMGIYNSNMIYIATTQTSADYSQNTAFSLQDNLKGIFIQSFQLIIAFLYLKWRKFDFSQWKFKINWKNTLFGISLFILCALMMDVWVTLWYYLMPSLVHSDVVKPALQINGNSIFSIFNFSTVLYSLLNGPYEEIFFLGICLSVKPIYQKWAFLYSIIIRISFHTYQGLESAFGIGIILTVIYCYFYIRKNNNLYPYFLSHTIADIFGLGIIYHIAYII